MSSAVGDGKDDVMAIVELCVVLEAWAKIKKLQEAPRRLEPRCTMIEKS